MNALKARLGSLKKLDTNTMILIGILLGIVLGSYTGWRYGESMLSVKWLGDFFLDALKMLIVPLIVFSMISGVASLGDVRRVGRTGTWTLGYYFATTVISVVIGLILVNLMQPGAGAEISTELPDRPAFSLIDIIRSLITPNIIAAAARGEILPLIVFSLIFGGLLTTLGEKGRRAVQLCDTVNQAILGFVKLIMWLAPVGVFGLIAGRLATAGGGDAFWIELKTLGSYSITVILGLFIHATVVLPLMLLIFARRNPGRYLINVAPALTTAFSTASSSATLPITMECAEKRNRVSQRASRFVLPLGATINMDGTALYEAVAAMFIAQACNIPMSLGDQIVIVLMATLASIGAAGIPEAGLVTMVIVLQAVDLPLEGITTILAIDWFLDRCRTTVNVWGDSVGAAVVSRQAGLVEPGNSD